MIASLSHAATSKPEGSDRTHVAMWMGILVKPRVKAE